MNFANGVELKKLVDIKDADDLTLPCRGGTKITDFAVRRCARLNPGDFLWRNKLRKFLIGEAVEIIDAQYGHKNAVASPGCVCFTDQGCPAGFSRLEQLEVDAVAITQNKEFFERAKFPSLQSLIINGYNFFDPGEEERIFVNKRLREMVPSIKYLIFDDCRTCFDFNELLPRCTACESIQVGTWTSRWMPSDEFVTALIRAKENEEPPRFRTLKFADNQHRLSDKMRSKLLAAIPDLEVQIP
jgi:hypothetical protein